MHSSELGMVMWDVTQSKHSGGRKDLGLLNVNLNFGTQTLSCNLVSPAFLQEASFQELYFIANVQILQAVEKSKWLLFCCLQKWQGLLCTGVLDYFLPAFGDLSVVTHLSPGNLQITFKINAVFRRAERLSEKVYCRTVFSPKLGIESHRPLPVGELREWPF